MWLPGGQWQSLILRTFLDYPYFCVVWAATGIHTSCKVLQKVLPWNAFPRSLCEAALSPGGILSDSLQTHYTESRWGSQHGKTGQRAGSYPINGVSTGHGIECLWVTAALLTLRTLSSPCKLRLHNRVNRTHCPKPRTATKWHAHSEFPLLCPFSLYLSEVTSFCFTFILFSGTWRFAWTQCHTRLKTGSVNTPSPSASPACSGRRPSSCIYVHPWLWPCPL